MLFDNIVYAFNNINNKNTHRTECILCTRTAHTHMNTRARNK